MPGPLHGYRIIDLTNMISGPLGTMILADQGANVIKIEAPGGDYTRSVSTRRGGFSASFLNNNRNKRSLCIDLKHEHGHAVLLRVLAGADVIVQNFRPGVIERMGLDEASVRAVAPTIVYVSISGFGHNGPYAGKPVYDPLVQALSGLATIQAGSDHERPRLVRTIVPDKLTGVTSSQAITAALLARERTGKGQHVRLSMLDSVIAFLWGSDMGSQTFIGDEIDQAEAQSFIDLIYETSDGHISVAVQSDKQWKGLCSALDQPEWLRDERFLSAVLRHQYINDRLELTQQVLRGNTSAHWLERLEAADVPCVPVLRRSEMIHHPQIRDSALLMELQHPHAGALRQPRPAATFSGTSPDRYVGAPALGEHNDAVLGEAGYSNDEIADLHAQGVLHAVAPGGAQ
jgi:crotonobetainyl-CoA:carnitine CoA-transferase CaiB-like acyl-CoA transferase